MRNSIRSGMFVVVSLVLVSATLGQERREIRFPDISGYQTLMCDFHMHTVFSDGLVWPTTRVDEAWREGLDLIAMTDHIEYQPHKADIPTKHNRSYELAKPYADERDIIVLSGTEITRDTPPGHHNAIFLSDVDPLDTPEFFDVFDEATKQKAFLFWNHPGWQGEAKGQWGDKQQTLLDKKQLHGIEVCNGRKFYEYSHKYAVENNLTLLANSDSHNPTSDKDWTAENHRTLTLVFAKERSIEGVREALFAGRTAMWWQNKLVGQEAELKPLIAKSVTVAPSHFARGNHVFAKVTNSCELDLEFERVGKLGAKSFTLPAGKTMLVAFEGVNKETPEHMQYRITNVLVGVKTPLEMTLTIPKK